MSEKKELKEEDISKVSGGDNYVHYYCNKCKKPFNDVNFGVKNCPKCGSDDIIQFGDI